MIINSLVCNSILFICNKVYPTVRCLEILRETEDVYLIKKWLSFFVMCTIFQSLYYCVSALFMFPVEVELVLLLFMIVSDAKGSFLLYQRLNKLSDWTRPLENLINFSKTCDSEDLVKLLETWFQSFHKKVSFWEQNKCKQVVKEEFKQVGMTLGVSNTSIESLGSSVQIVDNNDVPNEIDKSFNKSDDEFEQNDCTQENEEGEHNNTKPKKRTKKTE